MSRWSSRRALASLRGICSFGVSVPCVALAGYHKRLSILVVNFVTTIDQTWLHQLFLSSSRALQPPGRHWRRMNLEQKKQLSRTAVRWSRRSKFRASSSSGRSGQRFVEGPIIRPHRNADGNHSLLRLVSSSSSPKLGFSNT